MSSRGHRGSFGKSLHSKYSDASGDSALSTNEFNRDNYQQILRHGHGRGFASGHKHRYRRTQSAQFVQMNLGTTQPTPVRFSTQDIRLKVPKQMQDRVNPGCSGRSQFNKQHEQRCTDRHKIFCPKCSKCFDLNERMPLQLECAHLMCEVCLRSKLTPDGLATECGDCRAKVSLQLKVQGDFHIRMYFPINYYMVGKLYCYKFQEKDEPSMLVFCREPTPSPGSSSLSIIDKGVLARCESAGCKEEATLRCWECEADLCASCTERTHSSLKNLNHRIFSTSFSPCKEHNGQPREFYCYDCRAHACTYCIIEVHKDHTFKQSTKLESADVEKFEFLLDSCKETLTKLQTTQKIVQKRTAKFSSEQPDDNLEKTVGKYFNELHGKLQRIETKLLRDAACFRNTTRDSLMAVDGELKNYIADIKDLIQVGGTVIQPKKFGAGQNVDIIMHRMENAALVPYYLKELDQSGTKGSQESQFEFVQFDDLESHFKMNKSSVKVFKLVREDPAGDALNSSVVYESEASDISEITIGTNPNKSILVVSGDQEFMLRKQSIDFSENKCVTGECMEMDIMFDIEAVNFQQNSMENVVVTNIISPENFHVQLTRHYKVLQDVHKKIQYLVEKFYVSSIKDLKHNVLYLAKYQKGVTNSWRRVLVTDVFISRQECEVKYIDYGNIDTVLFNDMRTITDELAHIPPFSYECKLYDITEPPEQPWSKEDAALMAEMLSGNNVSMIIKHCSQTCYEVDLKVYSETNDFYLRDSLIFMGRTVCNSDNDENYEVIEPVHDGIISNEVVYNEQTIKTETFKAVITNIVDSITVFVQDVEQIDHFNSLKRSLAEFYNKTNIQKAVQIYLPKVGSAVAVQQYDTDGALPAWYRGLVCNIEQGTGTVRVLLVDTGHETIASYKDLRVITKRFTSYTRMALQVQLVHVSYDNEVSNHAGMEYLKRFTKKPVKVKVHAQVSHPEVILFDVFDTYDICINAYLARNLGLKSSGFVSQELEWPHDEAQPKELEQSVTSSLIAQSQNMNTEGELSDDCNGMKLVPIKVVHVVNPDCIHIHPLQNESFMSQLSQFDIKFQKYYSINRLLLRSEWEVDQTCAAYNKMTKQYCRAVIMKRLSTNHYEVMGMDFGQSFETSREAMGELHEDFKIPALALKVSLYGIKPLGPKWSLTATDYLRSMLIEKMDVFMTSVKDEPKLNVNTPVILWLRKTKQAAALERTNVINTNVNKRICRHGLGILLNDWIVPDDRTNSESDSSTNKCNEFEEQSMLLPASIETSMTNERKAWLPMEHIGPSPFQAVATNVDESGRIYFHDTNAAELLKELEDRMFAKFQFAESVQNETWNVGDLCTVKYHANQKFYRGKVVGLGKDVETVRVQMIDYGNLEDCKYDEVWKEVCFLQVPPVAKMLSLHGVKIKKDVSVHVLDTLHVLVVERVIDVQIRNHASWSRCATAIVFQGKTNVNAFVQNLLTEEEKQTIRPKHVAVSDSDEDVVIENVLVNEVLTHSMTLSSPATSVKSLNIRLSYKYVPLPTIEVFEVSIINVLSTNRVVFEVATTMEENVEFNRLQNDINKGWKFQPIIDNICEDQVCIARYITDKKWYRGKLLKVDEVMYIYFVDFGNLELFSESTIRHMKPEWLEHPVSQFMAILSDFKVKLEGHHLFLSAVQQHLKEYVNTSKLVKITNLQPLSVKLYDVETRELAYQELFTTNILKPLE